MKIEAVDNRPVGTVYTDKVMITSNDIIAENGLGYLKVVKYPE